MLFVIVAMLDRLNLRLAIEPKNEMISRLLVFIPNMFGAAILALVT